MALTGLDFHQLNSFEGFHQLISDPPFPRFSQRDSPGSSILDQITAPFFAALPTYRRFRTGWTKN
jgi:hypothetical protein